MRCGSYYDLLLLRGLKRAQIGTFGLRFRRRVIVASVLVSIGEIDMETAGRIVSLFGTLAVPIVSAVLCLQRRPWVDASNFSNDTVSE